MQLLRLLCVVAGLIGVSFGRTVPVSLPVSAFTWPMANGNNNNDYQQSAVVDDLGYAVTDNPGRIEPRQSLAAKNLAFEYVNDISMAGGNDNFLFFTEPEAQKTNTPNFAGRTLHKNQNPPIYVMNLVVANNNTNNNTQITESTTAAATRMGDFIPAGYYRAPPPPPQSYAMPMQYFRTQQDQPQLYGGWNDLALFGGGIGSGTLPRVPLVPISLPNNQVGYVPLNLRMFRQLASGLPIRENTQQADEQQQQQQKQQNQQILDETNNEDEQEDDVPLSMLSLQSDENLMDTKPSSMPNDSTLLPTSGASGNFNLLGQRIRSQRPIMAVRNPFQAFAKNMNLRRVQYV